mgnify:CR=1 FL=1
MKKRKLAVMLTAALAISVLALSGCSQNSAPAQSTPPESSGSAQPQDGGQAPDLLAQIQEKGEIVVAMEGTWAPWTYHDESDALVGFDVEVAQNIAEKLGVTATFVEGEWDGLLAGLDAGRYDIMVNGVDITEDRAAKYDFSTPYAYNRTAVIVSGDNGDIQAMEDLSGKHTANTIYSCQLFHVAMTHLIQVIIKMTAEHFGICKTDPGDPQSINQSRKCGMGGRFNRTDQVIIGFLTKAFHFCDHFFMAG